jgi:hypothetical protein
VQHGRCGPRTADQTPAPSRSSFAVDVLADSRITHCNRISASSVSSPCSDLGAGLFAGSPFFRSVGMQNMIAPIANGTDVRVAFPASPPLRLTIRACLDDHCRQYRLPSIAASPRAGRRCPFPQAIAGCGTDHRGCTACGRYCRTVIARIGQSSIAMILGQGSVGT